MLANNIIFMVALAAGLLPFGIGLYRLYKGEKSINHLLLFCVTFLVGSIVHIQWGSLRELRENIANLEAHSSQDCPWLLIPTGSPVLADARQVANDTCGQQKFRRDKASVVIPREAVMPVWCKLLEEADEVLATNVAGAIDWEQFKGQQDPCALSCQTKATNIQRVFIYDENSKNHKEFSSTCASLQNNEKNIETKLISLQKAQSGPPAEIPRAVERVGGLDIVIVRKGSEKVAMLTDVDMTIETKIALRSYFYENSDRVENLEKLFRVLWRNAKSP